MQRARNLADTSNCDQNRTFANARNEDDWLCVAWVCSGILEAPGGS